MKTTLTTFRFDAHIPDDACGDSAAVFILRAFAEERQRVGDGVVACAFNEMASGYERLLTNEPDCCPGCRHVAAEQAELMAETYAESGLDDGS